MFFICIEKKEILFMNYNMFRFINRLSGRYSSLDLLMIFLSNKMRYVFLMVLFFMWVRNDFSKRIAFHALLSSGVAVFINLLIKVFSFSPRPFERHRVGILTPSKTDSSSPSKHRWLPLLHQLQSFFINVHLASS